MTDENDPLDGADIGDTGTVSHTAEFEFWDTVWATEMHGRDRELTDIDIADARIGGDPGNETIVIELEGEVMKTLPRRWDHVATADNGADSSAETSPLVARVIRAVSLLIPVGIVVGIAYLIFDELSQTTVNGELMIAPSLPGLLGICLGIVSVVTIAILVASGAVPTRVDP